MHGENAIAKVEKTSGDRLAVHEIFYTVQGEQPFMGRPAIFIRLSGCTLRCHFCFCPNTPILMGDNSRKRIDQVKVGDEIVSFNEDEGDFIKSCVSAVHVSEADEIYHVDVSNRSVWCTGDHPFLTSDRGWVAARDLVRGDKLVHWNVHARMRMFNPGGRAGHTQESRERAAERMRALWRNPTFRERQIYSMTNSNPMRVPEIAARSHASREDLSHMTKYEKVVQTACKGLPVTYVGDGSLEVAHKFPDFAATDGQKKLIEVWAADALFASQRDEAWQENRRRRFSGQGYETLFLPLLPADLSLRGQREIRRRVSRFLNNAAVVRQVRKCGTKSLAALYGASNAPKMVYNLEVEDTHTYVAHNLVVHNCDTEFEGVDWRPSVPEIIDECSRIVDEYRTPVGTGGKPELVVITGGEPLRQNIVPLTRMINIQLGLPVQVETAGINAIQDLDEARQLFGDGMRNTIVCSPKTPKLHPDVVPLIEAYRYVLRCDEGVDPDDGLPVYSTQIPGKQARLARPHSRDVPVYVSPCDEDPDQGEAAQMIADNYGFVADVAMRYGYRVSVQLHKILQLP